MESAKIWTLDTIEGQYNKESIYIPTTDETFHGTGYIYVDIYGPKANDGRSDLIQLQVQKGL